MSLVLYRDTVTFQGLTASSSLFKMILVQLHYKFVKYVFIQTFVKCHFQNVWTNMCNIKVAEVLLYLSIYLCTLF